MSREWNYYSLILDSLDVSAELPFEIIPDHWFRKADALEIKQIKEQLFLYNNSYLHYEYEIVGTNNGHQGQEWQLALPENWRYYVVSVYGTNAKLRDIEYAANLIENDISLGFTFINDIAGIRNEIGIDISMVSTIFADHYVSLKTPKPFSSVELFEISDNHNLIVGLDKSRYSNVFKAISDFHQTKSIPDRSMLKNLSYFSIIECLLTHPPFHLIGQIQPRARYLPKCLLSKRFQREIDFKSSFPRVNDLENAWKKLYNYRTISNFF